MIQIIRFTALQQTPWKNGGGTTREIAIARAADALIWRLSIADVGVDGPFSKFDGLRRILTVIDGHGMELIGPHETLQANYAVPLSFDGALEIHSRLKDGPLRDLNLIYNPALCTGRAQMMVGYSRHSIEAKFGQIIALHCIRGSISLGDIGQLHQGDTALIDGDAIHYTLAEGASALLISIQTVANNCVMAER